MWTFLDIIAFKWGFTCQQHCARRSVGVGWLVLAFPSLVILFLPAFICIMTKFLTVMTLNLWFIKTVTTWVSWVLILSSTSDIHRIVATSSSGRTSSFSSRIVSPLPLPRLMDECDANAPSNDVIYILILCSWLMRGLQIINGKHRHIFVFFQGHNQGFKFLGNISKKFFNDSSILYIFFVIFSWFIIMMTLV